MVGDDADPQASTSCTPEDKTPNSDPALLLQDSMYPTKRLSFIRHLVHLPDIFSQSDISDDATKTSIVFNLLIFRILNTNRQVSVFAETCLRHPFSASVLIRQLVFSPDHSSRTIGHPPTYSHSGQRLGLNGWNMPDRKVKIDERNMTYPDPWRPKSPTPRPRNSNL